MEMQSQKPSWAQPQNEVEHPQPAPPASVADWSAVKGKGNRRKRARKAPDMAPRTPPAGGAAYSAAASASATESSKAALLHTVSQYSSPPPPLPFVSPMVPLPNFANPGFQLFKEQQQQLLSMRDRSTPPTSQVFEDASGLINQYQGEIDGYLRSQDEQVRKTLAEKWQRHCRTVLCATEMAALRRIREKEEEAESAARQCAELEERLSRSRMEIMMWQSKAAAAQSRTAASQNTIAILRAELDRLQTPREGAGESGGGDTDDAESAHVDLFPVPPGACHVCRKGKAVVAAVPCGHLCLCTACDVASAAELCPWCKGLSSGTVRIHSC